MSIATPGVRRIGLNEFEAMANDGRLDPTVGVELLDGVVVPKTTKGLRHVAITRRVQRMLREALPPGWADLKEDPVRLQVEAPGGGGAMPEPDAAVAAGGEADYEARYPGPADLGLVVEVASNAKMLKADREGLARYARNGVRVVWLVNLPANVVEVYSDPSGPGDDPVFEGNTVARPGDTITLDLGPLGGDGGGVVRVAVSDLLA